MTVKVSNLTFVALFAVIFMVIFSFTVTLIASVYIVSDLGGSNDIAIYTISFYGLGNALGMPLARSLSYKHGTVNLLCVTLHLFAIFSLLCGFSTNYPEFLTYRLLQGIVSAPFYVLTNQLFADLTPEKRKPFFLTIFLTIFTTVPILGATWGGWLAYNYHWKAAFFINFIFLFILAWFIKRDLNGYQPPIEPYKLDGIGYFAYFVGVFSLVCVAITGQELDWLRSPIIVALIILGLGCLIFFLLWSQYHPTPLFELHLFKEPIFVFGIVNLIILFASYFGIVVLLAQWLSLDVLYTPYWIGLLLCTMVAAGFVPSFLLGKRLKKLDPRIPLAMALICFVISCFHTTFFNQYIDFERIALSRIPAGFGLVLFLPPIFHLCFHSFAKEKLIPVMELFQVSRALACVIGTSFYITLWQRRRVFYHDRYGSDLTLFSEKTRQFFSDIKAFHISGSEANAQLNEFLDKQSNAFALDDCFFLMQWTLMGLLVMLLCTYFWKNRSFVPEQQS